jgi:hypothetical protein
MKCEHDWDLCGIDCTGGLDDYIFECSICNKIKLVRVDPDPSLYGGEIIHFYYFKNKTTFEKNIKGYLVKGMFSEVIKSE